jgi:serine/threonine-protein kinase RsbT
MGDRTVRHHISTDADVVAARRSGRQLAQAAGFGTADLTTIATAISEVAQNIMSYAGHGEITISVIERGGQRGIEVRAADEGPGIADVDRALEGGFPTSRGMGLGLPGVRRLMDELVVDSTVGAGTTVVMRKWTG